MSYMAKFLNVSSHLNDWTLILKRTCLSLDLFSSAHEVFNNLSETALEALLVITAVAPPERIILGVVAQIFQSSLKYFPAASIG